MHHVSALSVGKQFLSKPAKAEGSGPISPRLLSHAISTQNRCRVHEKTWGGCPSIGIERVPTFRQVLTSHFDQS